MKKSAKNTRLSSQLEVLIEEAERCGEIWGRGGNNDLMFLARKKYLEEERKFIAEMRKKAGL